MFSVIFRVFTMITYFLARVMMQFINWFFIAVQVASRCILRSNYKCYVSYDSQLYGSRKKLRCCKYTKRKQIKKTHANTYKEAGLVILTLHLKPAILPETMVDLAVHKSKGCGF